MTAAATRSLERAKLYISKSIEQKLEKNIGGT